MTGGDPHAHFPTFHLWKSQLERLFKRSYLLCQNPRFTRRQLRGLLCAVVLGFVLFFWGFYLVGRATEPFLFSAINHTGRRDPGWFFTMGFELNQLAMYKSQSYQEHVLAHLPKMIAEPNGALLIPMMYRQLPRETTNAVLNLISSDYISEQSEQWRRGVSDNAHLILYCFVEYESAYAQDVAEIMLLTLPLEGRGLSYAQVLADQGDPGEPTE